MAINPKTAPSRAGAEIDRSVLFKALSHPLRYRIMMILGEREASPKELSDELDEKFSLVYEHVCRLEDWALIELVDTDTKHGGTQHFYRARTLPILDTEEWAKVPRYEQMTTSDSIILTITKEISDSVAAGLFDNDPTRVLIRKPLQVDQRGKEEVDEAGVQHLRAIEEAEANSLARVVDGGEPTSRVISVTMAFPAASPVDTQAKS